MAQATQQVTHSTGDQVEGSAVCGDVTKLVLELGNGEVICRTADLEPGQVELSWVVKARKEGFRRGNPQDLEIVVTEKDGLVTVEDIFHGKKLESPPHVEMNVLVHEGIECATTLGNGTIELDVPLVGGVELGNGTIDVKGSLVADAAISLGNGNVKGSLVVDSGEHDIAVGNGRIRLNFAEGSSFLLDSSVGTGDIDISGVRYEKQRNMLGATASATVDTGAGEVDLSVGNGTIELEVG